MKYQTLIQIFNIEGIDDNIKPNILKIFAESYSDGINNDKPELKLSGKEFVDILNKINNFNVKNICIKEILPFVGSLSGENMVEIIKSYKFAELYAQTELYSEKLNKVLPLLMAKLTSINMQQIIEIQKITCDELFIQFIVSSCLEPITKAEDIDGLITTIPPNLDKSIYNFPTSHKEIFAYLLRNNKINIKND